MEKCHEKEGSAWGSGKVVGARVEFERRMSDVWVNDAPADQGEAVRPLDF